MMPKRAMIGLATYKTVPALSVANLLRTTVETVGAGLVAGFNVQTDMYIVMARNNITLAAIEAYEAGHITHLWWLDDDIIVPTGALEKLMAHDVPAVGAVYYTNALKPVAYDIEPFRFLESVPASGLHPVGGLGMGCTLIDCQVLIEMRKHFGDSVWFATSTHFNADKTPLFYGEDVWFFKRLQEMGYQTHIDCDITCGHVHYSVIDEAAFRVKQRLQKEQGLSPEQIPVIA